MNDLPSPAHATTASVDLSVIRFHVRLSRRCRIVIVFFVVNARVSARVRRVSLSVGASLAYGWMMDRRDRLPKKTKRKKKAAVSKFRHAVSSREDRAVEFGRPGRSRRVDRADGFRHARDHRRAALAMGIDGDAQRARATRDVPVGKRADCGVSRNRNASGGRGPRPPRTDARDAPEERRGVFRRGGVDRAGGGGHGSFHLEAARAREW